MHFHGAVYVFGDFFSIMYQIQHYSLSNIVCSHSSFQNCVFSVLNLRLAGLPPGNLASLPFANLLGKGWGPQFSKYQSPQKVDVCMHLITSCKLGYN